MNKYCYVKAEDLTHSSNIKVSVRCDYCGDVIEKTYSKYIKQRDKIKKDACYKCFPIKQKEVCKITYGVESTFQLKHVKEKSLKTINEKYGVDNVMQSPEIQEAFRESMIANHGVEYAQQSHTIRDKTTQTLINKYGVDSVIKIKGMKSKCNNFEYVNSKKVSKAQRQISDYLGGHLNINIGGYFADILISEDGLIIEYDGSGHDLSVRLGSITEEEFNNREALKFNCFLNQCYKYLIIKNPTEKTINKNVLQQISKKISELNNKNMSYAILNIQ